MSSAVTSDDTAEPLLKVSRLGWSIKGLEILVDVGLEVRAGELISIIGPNGAGKTSLVNVISGITRPTSGEIRFSGADITRSSPQARARAGIGRTFQTSSVFPAHSVIENARVAAQAARGSTWNPILAPRPSDDASRIARAALHRVGLGGKLSSRAGDLSHGEKRKLEIALLLCGDATLLLLDEPTAGASSADIGPITDIIASLRDSGKTVLMVEHRMELVMSLSDRVAVMHEGRLLICDIPQTVMANDLVREAYLGVAW